MSRVGGRLTLVIATIALLLPAAASASQASACHATRSTGAVDASLDTTSLGPRAPARYEIGVAAAGRTDRIMLFIHGGGWTKTGQGALNSEHAVAAAWRRAGWTTINLDYRACRKSSADILTFYDLIRDAYGPDVPICAEGESAGGHLALTLAVRRPDIACVIAYAAPTDLVHGTATVRAIARSVFGARRLTRMSPVARAGAIRARVLLATAQDDPLVPLTQATALRDAVSDDVYVDVVSMPPGARTFVHGTTTPAALRALQLRVAALVKPYGTGPVSLPPPPFGRFPPPRAR